MERICLRKETFVKGYPRFPRPVALDGRRDSVYLEGQARERTAGALAVVSGGNGVILAKRWVIVN